MENKREQAIFSGGCFWCTEAVFKNLKGVISVTPGYAGGSVENPTYEQVSSGKTGHAEVIRLEFNPEEIKYPDLLNVFFATHNPTTLNQQGNDMGTQYRSAIFYTNDEQRQEAEREVRELEAAKTFTDPILTELRPLDKFYEAEDYHKNYYQKNQDKPYCQVVIDPKIAKLRQKFSHLLIVIAALIFLGAGCTNSENKVSTVASDRETESAPAATTTARRLDFSQYNSLYRFSAELPAGLAIEYVPEIQSINIHDGEQAQLFIRYFAASNFLTLQTVAILNREETSVNGHAAVRYEIAKKSGVANFPHQPSWRNARHQLTDIRYQKASPSYFYVFSYNPAFAEAQFEAFIQSLRFHNDAASFVPPLANAGSRVTKKPFGVYITPENSPVQPERFSGYHTGTDFETFPEEQGIDVPVFAICGGELVSKRTASGYGGLVVQACERAGQTIRVVYGHIALSSVRGAVGDYLAPGERLAGLGEAGKDTDNERKHLHLGVRKGTNADISGYVASERALKDWVDPALLR